MSIDINAKLIEMGASKFAFARECFTGVMELPSPKFHREICADLDNQEMMNYVVQAPRGHAKTTYVGCIDPIHELLFSGIMGKKPEFITLVSKTTSHTRSLVKTIIDHVINNPALKYYFGSIMPDWFNPDKWIKSTEDEIHFPNRSVLLALGLGSAIHGLTRYNMRPSRFVIDDAEDDNNASTRASIDKNYEWFEKALYAARDKHRCRTAVIGTMINENCLVDRLSKTDGWTSRFYQAIPEWEDGMPEKPVLWPEMWSFDELMAEKRKLEKNGKGHIWWMNYQNQYKTGDNQPFKREYFRTYFGDVKNLGNGVHAISVKTAKDSDGKVIIEDKVIPVNVFWGYDPASSVQARADETAISFWGMDNKKNLYLLWKFHKRIDPMAAAKIFYDKAIEMSPVTGNIETVQAQETIRSYLRDRCDEDGTWIPGIDRKNQPRAKKSERLISNLWRFQSGRVYVREGIDGDLIGQYTNYVIDKETQHEDMMDADYYAFLNAFPCDTEWADSEDDVKKESGSMENYLIDYGYEEEETSWMSFS